MTSSNEQQPMLNTISLHQPWAALWASGHKRCETRTWPLPESRRGLLLVHAAKYWNKDYESLCQEWPFRDALLSKGFIKNKPFPDGIIGGVYVRHVLSTDKEYTDPATGKKGRLAAFLSEEERAFGDFSRGRFAWKAEGAVLFDEPIPYRGFQGVFRVMSDRLSQKQIEQIRTIDFDKVLS